MGNKHTKQKPSPLQLPSGNPTRPPQRSDPASHPQPHVPTKTIPTTVGVAAASRLPPEQPKPTTNHPSSIAIALPVQQTSQQGQSITNKCNDFEVGRLEEINEGAIGLPQNEPRHKGGDWTVLFAQSLQKRKTACLNISQTHYGWVILGIVHSSCHFKYAQQLWDQKCVFFNLGSRNLWVQGSKIQADDQSQADDTSQFTLTCNLEERKLIWANGNRNLAQLTLPTSQLDEAVCWTFFCCAYRGDQVSWRE